MRFSPPPDSAHTGPTPGRRVAAMSFGVVRRRPERDADHDGYCRAYSVALAAYRRTPDADGLPTFEQVIHARSLVATALGDKRRRLVGGRLYTRDRTGAVHVVGYTPKARRLAPYLIRSFGPLSA